jgi:hypothetical protein
MVENFFARLFQNNFVQTADELLDFRFENLAHRQLLFDFLHKFFRRNARIVYQTRP